MYIVSSVFPLATCAASKYSVLLIKRY